MIKRILRRLNRKSPAAQARENGATIGTNFNMLSGAIIDPDHAWHITIGNYVTLAPRVHILAHDASTKHALGYTRLAKVAIGDRVFLGAGTIVLPGVTIGDKVIVGAGSVVTSDIPSGSVYGGIPARFICSYDEYIDKRREEMENSPVFDESYSVDHGISEEMKVEMNAKMDKGVGYVV
ncbi:acyltransferase [Alteromonas confluentis]|uniref:Acetyltransferase n=1 Tax=Alteromonas confluentis TaxID=1656094 RepID=A0A1E7ZA59_9ALTE|nr:acyltransferase [Alteromonas confluentis]OFC70423.1 acetyltransferase [Alteromonas confluentis]